MKKKSYHLKQITSSNEQTEKENTVGTVIGDETSEKVGCRQTVRGKEKQKGEAIHIIECKGKTMKFNKRVNQTRWRTQKIRNQKKWRKIGISYFKTKDQAIKAIETLDKSKQYVAK